MSVLAGAPELVFFNFGNIMDGHPDHKKLMAELDKIVDLAAFVRAHPVTGVPAYKPPNSKPGGDMYIMDFLGMLGIPLVPVHEFPDEAPIVFLPAQAAMDPGLPDHLHKALTKGTRVVVTTNLLIKLPDSSELSHILGINPNIQSKPSRASVLSFSQKTQSLEKTDVVIDLESPVHAKAEHDGIVCTDGERNLILFAQAETSLGRVGLLNTHTYNQDDFDAVGEVLLCPCPLGLLNLRRKALRTLRVAFSSPKISPNGNLIQSTLWPQALDAPSGVTFHPFLPASEGAFY